MTLAEVVVMLALVTLLISGIYAGIVNAVHLNYAVAQRVAAFGLCRDTLEQMRGIGYDQVNTTRFGTTNLWLTHLGGSQMIPLSATRTCTIASHAGPIRKEVNVTIAWTFRGKPFEESIRTYIFKRE